MNSNNQVYFPILDCFRVFAAVYVAVFHLTYWLSFPFSTPGKLFQQVAVYNEMDFFSKFGWVGVEIFFVISGFVIANSSANNMPIKFLFNRALRLFPAVWVCATITLCTLLLAGIDFDRVLREKYLHAMLIIPSNIGWVDGSYWTLIYEVAFYLLIFLSLFFPKLFTSSRLAIAITFMSFTYLMLNLLKSIGIEFFVGNAIISLPFKINYFFDYFLQFKYGCFFALGMFAFIYAKQRLTSLQKLLMLFSLVGCLVGIHLHAKEFMQGANTHYSTAWPITIFLISMVLMFLSIRKPPVLSFSPTALKYVRVAGLMTYPIYLLHDAVGAYFMRLMIVYGLNRWVALLLIFSAIGMMSYIICMKLEPVIRHFLRSLLACPRHALKDAL